MFGFRFILGTGAEFYQETPKAPVSTFNAIAAAPALGLPRHAFPACPPVRIRTH
jgi:hypothetical protein